MYESSVGINITLSGICASGFKLLLDIIQLGTKSFRPPDKVISFSVPS